MSFSPDCKYIVVGNILGDVVVYTVRTGKKTVAYREDGEIKVVRFSGDNKSLMAGFYRKNPKMPELSGGEISIREFKGH